MAHASVFCLLWTINAAELVFWTRSVTSPSQGPVALSILFCLISLRSQIWSFSPSPSFSSHPAPLLWVSAVSHLEHCPGGSEPGDSKPFAAASRIKQRRLMRLAGGCFPTVPVFSGPCFLPWDTFDHSLNHTWLCFISNPPDSWGL